MPVPSLPLIVDPDSPTSLQRQIVEQIRRLVAGDALRPETPLPSIRRLAGDLGVARNTVVQAYERLIAEGYLEARPQVGTFVAKVPPASARLPEGADAGGGEGALPACQFQGRRHHIFPAAKRAAIDFRVGRPDPWSFPFNRWKRLLAACLNRASVQLTEYGDPQGLSALRQAIADKVAPMRGIAVEPSQVIITVGIQEAINLAIQAFVSPGSRVVVEDPCYQGAAYALQRAGAMVSAVPVDDGGLRVDLLPPGPVRLIYVTPSHQYPLGGVLSLERRRSLLEWARATGALIIEDDYDGDFRHENAPLPALAALDGLNSVIHMGTFSKSLGAGLRIGYMLVPKPIAAALTDLKALLNNGNSWLEQAALADYIGSGAYGEHICEIRTLYRRRRDVLVAAIGRAFGDSDVTGCDGGMHVAWHLPPDMPDAAVLAERLQMQGVAVYTLGTGGAAAFGPDSQWPRTLLLGYVAVAEPDIERAVELMARERLPRPRPQHSDYQI
ncbi:MAG: PLP-dependent aminotransferase family protein [Hyphomicrobiales bacterium]